MLAIYWAFENVYYIPTKNNKHTNNNTKGGKKTFTSMNIL